MKTYCRILLLSVFSLPAWADPISARAVLLNAVYGEVPISQPQSVRLKVISGPAKGCVLQASAYLNKPHRRYEFHVPNNVCEVNQQVIEVGQVVRGQHAIKGAMANSGMGRDYLIANKGLTVTLALE